MYRSVRKDLLTIPGSPLTLVVKHRDGNWLIDPGMGSDRANIILGVLNKAQINDYNIMVSHTHYDHIEILPSFKDKRIYVNEFEYSQLINPEVREHATYGFNPLPRLLGLQKYTISSKNLVTFSLSERTYLGPLRLLDLSGHSPGLTGIIFDDVVFVGDSLFGDMLLKRVGIPYHSDVFKSIKVLIEVLRNLSEDGFEAILSHGPVVKNQRFRELVELNIERIEQIIELLNNELRRGGTIEELTIRVLRSLGVEVLASNVYLGSVTVASIINKLCEEGKVEHVVHDEGIKWRLIKH
ncbi:MAG: MBL fold metallo-hydrolase [Sulfolobales archaeon]